MLHLPFCLRILGAVSLLACLCLTGAPCGAANYYRTGFELSEGFFPGNINAQDNWTVDAGTGLITDAIAYAGQQSVVVNAGGAVSRTFAVGGEPVVWFDTYMRSVPATNPVLSGSPCSAALFVDTAGILLLDGDGAGGGDWVYTGVMPSPGSWFRVTIRLDFTAKVWDCYIDNVPVGTALGFQNDSVTTLNGMTLKAQPTGESGIDELAITDNAGSPYPDTDGDGILDILEGNPPAPNQTNRYLADSDGDGLDDGVEDANQNGARDAGETDPRDRDSDNDGVTDGIEVLVLNSNPLSAAFPGPLADSDGDELPDLLDVSGPNNCDSDGDRVADGFEAVMLGLTAVTNNALRPPIGDVNGDGFVSNVDALAIQSMFLGTVPHTALPNTTWSDLNRDGAISNVDALIAQSAFLGIVVCIPL